MNDQILCSLGKGPDGAVCVVVQLGKTSYVLDVNNAAHFASTLTRITVLATTSPKDLRAAGELQEQTLVIAPASALS